MHTDTSMGGTLHPFPTTVWPDLLAAGDPSRPEHRDRLDRVLRTYWKPVYAYVRTAWRKSVEDAKDLAQAFFAHVLEQGYLSRMSPDRGSFRGYLKRALKHFLIDAKRSESVRRPRTALLPLGNDPEELERIGPPSEEETPERAYDREWFHCLLESATESLREELTSQGKAIQFESFRRYCLESASSYREVAAQLGLTESDVRHYLSNCRAAYRRILRDRIREYVVAEDDIDRELREVLEG